MLRSETVQVLVIGALALGGLMIVSISGSGGSTPAAAFVPGPSAAPAPDAALPEGHPDVGGSAVPDVPDGAGTGTAELLWDVPAQWVAESPSSTMRRAQYRVPGPGGDGECVVFYFGPGQGGDALSNARRWASQFTQPDGTASEEVAELRELEVAGIPVLLVEVTGTYDGGALPGQPPRESLPGHMLLGAVARGPDANWFFKFTGPRQTVEDARGAFEAMVRSLRTRTATPVGVED